MSRAVVYLARREHRSDDVARFALHGVNADARWIVGDGPWKDLAARGASSIQAALAALPDDVDELLIADDASYGPFGDVWSATPEQLATWSVVRGDMLRRAVRDGDHTLPSQGTGRTRVALTDEGLSAGAVAVDRGLFTADPIDSDDRGLRQSRLARALAERGLQLDVIAGDLARDVPARSISTALGLGEVLALEAPPSSEAHGLRVVVIAHVYYEDMLDEILDSALLAAGARIVITTSGEERAERLRGMLRTRGVAAEVRAVASNRGRDVSAFLIGCADILEDDAVDVVMKLHGKRSEQMGGMAAREFKRLLLDALFPSQGYVTNAIARFAASERLGMLVPPMIHTGYPTLGRAWFTNRRGAVLLARRLGIDVPLDVDSPIAPYGSMFFARPAAMRPLVRGGLTWEDFPTEGEYRDGSVAHIVERLFVPAALDGGFAVHTIMPPWLAADSHALLEHKLDRAEGSVERRIARKVKRVPFKIGRIASRFRRHKR